MVYKSRSLGASYGKGTYHAEITSTSTGYVSQMALYNLCFFSAPVCGSHFQRGATVFKTSLKSVKCPYNKLTKRKSTHLKDLYMYVYEILFKLFVCRVNSRNWRRQKKVANMKKVPSSSTKARRIRPFETIYEHWRKSNLGALTGIQTKGKTFALTTTRKTGKTKRKPIPRVSKTKGTISIKIRKGISKGIGIVRSQWNFLFQELIVQERSNPWGEIYWIIWSGVDTSVPRNYHLFL